jgi:hypothetical protein
MMALSLRNPAAPILCVVVVQAFVGSSNAKLSVPASRELIDRGVLMALQKSRILQLHVVALRQGTSPVSIRIARLRLSVLRLLLALVVQLKSSRETLEEVATMLGKDGDGCLGPRALQIFSIGALSGGSPALLASWYSFVTVSTFFHEGRNFYFAQVDVLYLKWWWPSAVLQTSGIGWLMAQFKFGSATSACWEYP